MSISVEDVSTLEMYLQGVMNRSEHHAETVGAIALTLLGAVLWRKDATPLKVRSYDGQPANIIWFEVQAKRYALRYNHHAECIELREKTLNGEVLHRFSNRTSVTEVRKVFKDL